MDHSKSINKTFVSILVTGVFTTPLTLISPSEADSMFWMGVSKSRLIILAIQILAIVCLSLFLLIGTQKRYSTKFFLSVFKVFNNPMNYAILRNTLFGLALFLSFAFFYFSIFIPQALSAFSGWLAFSVWMVLRLFTKTMSPPKNNQPTRLSELFPRWKALTTAQKRTALTLLGVGLIYFCLFTPLNLRESGSLKEVELDEMITYPVVIKMLATQPNVRQALYQFFIYKYYIYGFPFFGFSAFLLLPVKLIFKEGLADQLQLNMAILRQFANVLPAVLSCFLFTWLATHFKKFWGSVILFIILLSLPGVIYLNSTFWHPDPINLFFIALTLYYLDRDQLRFGANFYFAAIACGISVATRLFGLFFFLAIAWLLVAGIIKKILTFRKALLAGTLFIFLLVGTILVANPYTFCPGELDAAKKTFARQQTNLTQGIDEADPNNIYRTGIDAWWPFMTRFYGSGATLGFLGASVLVGVFGTHRRNFHQLLLAWLLVIGTYMIGFVAVKSPWYLLPFLIPLYCGAFSIPENVTILQEKWKLNHRFKTAIRIGISMLVWGLGIFQITANISPLLSIEFLITR